MYRLRRQIFRQIVQKVHPAGFQATFVQYGGKDASKMCIKAYAVIYSEVPYASVLFAKCENKLFNLGVGKRTRTAGKLRLLLNTHNDIVNVLFFESYAACVNAAVLYQSGNAFNEPLRIDMIIRAFGNFAEGGKLSHLLFGAGQRFLKH